MSIHYGQLSGNKVDLSDIEKRLKALEADNATNKTGIASNKTDILLNGVRVATNTTNISTNQTNIFTNTTKSTSAYNKAVANGDKLLKKVQFMQNFDFHFTNPVVGVFNNAEGLIRGYPDVYAPLLHRTADTTIHIQLHVFDNDTKLDGTEKAEYRITFLQSDGNTVSWDSATQTISSKRLLYTVYEVDVKMTLGANFPNKWDTFRGFKFHYKPVTPTKVSGNESVVHVCVYSA